jgi:hypothetical protein
MKHAAVSLTLFLAVLAGHAAAAEDPPDKRSPKEALQAFNDLIGAWRCTGYPQGTQEQKRKGFWTESLDWSWRFKGKDVWLEASFEKGKNFSKGDLRYLPEKDVFQLTVLTMAKESLTFEGELNDRVLTLKREDDNKKEVQRLVVSLLHANRFLYRYEVKPQGKTLFTRLYEVGATKEGVPFAGPADASPECVVSGGRGTQAVTYKGKTYYFCCSGCRDAFKDEPEKYIKEFEEKKAKAAKEKGPK